ncbi:MAG: uL15 family ribosomal protein [Thermoplasmata archaeon]|nr:uL15 family ribosomal protein [Thermoplasmata archaeon]
MGKTKTSKHRGSRTYGRGKKAGRGHGKRGGVGAAGGHKHKWIATLKYDRDHYGQKGKGFKRPQSVVGQPITINVGQLRKLKERLIKDGIDKGGKEINLTALGYGKLLGSGVVQGAWQVTVDAATPRAVEKIESAGGKIEVPKA